MSASLSLLGIVSQSTNTHASACRLDGISGLHFVSGHHVVANMKVHACTSTPSRSHFSLSLFLSEAANLPTKGPSDQPTDRLVDLASLVVRVGARSGHPPDLSNMM